MFNKKYLPSFGLFVLLATIAVAIYYVDWAMGPLSYEKARTLEQQGHKSFAAKRYADSYKYFLKSAAIKDDNVSTSRRYRCAGSAAFQLGDIHDGIRLSFQALRLNRDNAVARKNILNVIASGKIGFAAINKFGQAMIENLFARNSIIYSNRTSDGWSRGNSSAAIVYVSKKCEFNIKMLTAMPSKNGVQAGVAVNGKQVMDLQLQPGQEYTSMLKLSPGVNIVNVKIAETFVPIEYNMNNDSRELGVNYRITTSCNE